MNIEVEVKNAFSKGGIPLNINGAENDIRCQVTRRKVSGGTCQFRR